MCLAGRGWRTDRTGGVNKLVGGRGDSLDGREGGRAAYEEHCVFCPGICVEGLEYRVFIFEGADAVGARERGLWLCHLAGL